MAFYNYLKSDFRSISDRKFVAKKIIKLKKQLLEEVPKKDSESNLLIGTWNIRDFGKLNRRGFGKRTKDSLYYIAEIISSFDIVAVQEVNELEEWLKVMKILGPSWDYIATDISDGKAGGNGERMTFVYDKRKVWFKNIAGEIVLPNNLLISKSELTSSDNQLVSGKQFRRTPYVVSFQSGWLKFDLCTVHIYYGQGSEGLKQRVKEIEAIAKYLSKRVDKRLKKEKKATILLGDFNIIRPDHDTMNALENNGFTIPKNIRVRKSNVIETMHYDQIAFKSDKDIIENVESISENNSGIFKIMKSVFTDSDEDFEFYKNKVEASSNSKVEKYIKNNGIRGYYKSYWRTYQMSDHNLLWARIKTNSSENYLNKIIQS
jgi:endonuclease/exonuclease/phosphatase family metal-dependent hydrolase